MSFDKTFFCSADKDHIDSSSNAVMALRGDDILEEVVSAYVRTALPHLPEEGVSALTAHLTTDEKLAHVSFHLGTMDLVLTKEYPPSVRTMADAFRALVAALWEGEGGQARTRKLVVDVVAAQLHGKDVMEVWDVQDPVAAVLQVTFTRTTLYFGQFYPQSRHRIVWKTECFNFYN